MGCGPLPTVVFVLGTCEGWQMQCVPCPFDLERGQPMLLVLQRHLQAPPGLRVNALQCGCL